MTFKVGSRVEITVEAFSGKTGKVLSREPAKDPMHQDRYVVELDTGKKLHFKTTELKSA